MALNLTRTYTYTAGNTIASAENNTNENTLYNAFAGLEAGTSSMSKLPLDGDPTSALWAATKQYVDAYANYKRPQLSYVGVATVDVSVNTGTANTTKILFPDGNYRSVTEDTASANKYRRFDITATAEFSSGTEDSGLRSGISEANNTWYAIYAVKSQINSANFVLVGDTTLPVIGSVSTLNSRYGTNGWVYLGSIRNGDSSGAAADILSFKQSGHVTLFTNSVQENTGETSSGIVMATSAGAVAVAWTYAAGTGDLQVPNNLGMLYWTGNCGSAGGNFQVLDDGSSTTMYRNASGTGRQVASVWMVATAGARQASTSSTSQDLHLAGFIDDVLGVGSNPFI